MANATPGGKGFATATRHHGATDENDFFWHHLKGAFVSLYFHITSVMSTNGLGQEVNKVRERLAHLDVPAELMRPPPPPRSKPVVTRYLPTARLASFTQGRGFQQGGREKTKKHLFFAVNSSDT